MQTTENPKPFLRWAGGKRWLIKHINGVEKEKFNNYYEPFLGGGSIFFHLNNFQNASLSDLNPDLITTYQCIRDNLEELLFRLNTFVNSESEYYRIRESCVHSPIDIAAKFLFLNKTSFNGIYRVNRNGKFNVPYGFRKNIVHLFDYDNLRRVSQKLQDVSIECQDFQTVIAKAQKGDLVFLDPPYTVAHENNGFIEYNQKIFSLDDQRRLADLVRDLNKRGVSFILTNAKHKAILEIYKNTVPPVELSRSSTIGGAGARRESFKEYLFSNCIGDSHHE